MVNHHPAPELLTAFSAGSLPLSHALCVSVHLDSCDQCRQNLQRLNSVGATLLATVKPRIGTDNLKTRVMAMLDDRLDEVPADPPAEVTSKPSRIPKALRQFVPESYDALRWQYLSPSIRTATLCTDINGSRVELLRIKPGGQVAMHTHTGDEYTLILEGSFSDEAGIYRAGDFMLRDGRHRHKPVATKDRECLCLTVTDAPIRFTGFFGRLFNPFLRKRYLPIY